MSVFRMNIRSFWSLYPFSSVLNSLPNPWTFWSGVFANIPALICGHFFSCQRLVTGQTSYGLSTRPQSFCVRVLRFYSQNLLSGVWLPFEMLVFDAMEDRKSTRLNSSP